MSHTFHSRHVAITTALETTPPIQLTDQVVGRISAPSAFSALTSLTFYTSETANGEFTLAIDVGATGVVSLIGGQSTKLPYELVGAGFVKIVGNAAGTIIVGNKT